MRASGILLPLAAASMVAGSPLNFEERDANTCTIKSIQSVVTKLSPSVAAPYCQSLLKISTKTVTKTLKPSTPSKHVTTATVTKKVTSNKKITKDVTATTSSSFNASDTRVNTSKKSTSTSSKKSSSSTKSSSSSVKSSSSSTKTGSSSKVTNPFDFSEVIFQPYRDTFDKQQPIVIKHGLIEIIKQHSLDVDIVLQQQQQYQKLDNEFIKHCSISFVLCGHSQTASSSETVSSSIIASSSPSSVSSVSTTSSSQYTSSQSTSGPSTNATASSNGTFFSNQTSMSAGPSASSSGFANISSNAEMTKRDFEKRANMAVSTKKTTSIKKTTSSKKASTTNKIPIVKKATSTQKSSSSKKTSTSLKSTSTKKAVTSSKKISTSVKAVSTSKKASPSTSSIKTSSPPINKGQPAQFNGLNNAQQSSICSCLHVPTPTFTQSIFVDSFTTVTSTVTSVQTLVSSTTTTAYHTTTAKPNLFYIQVSSKSKTSIDGQWAVLPGGEELLRFTSSKAGASEFFFAEPNLLVEYSSNFLANVEPGDFATSFYMNSVSRMYNVSAVPLTCRNQGGELSCESGDLQQLYWCSVWGTTSLVFGPSDYNNGLCKPVSLEIVPA
ncbi:hypothetical protein QM012_006356 [Aureobasidium pullulans]|uniref:Ubiquitin 3 binding protein But2 C-terminal domain-containing protein n=1 Tax=Aureobasidium pullulans TaxID=5580 RepID=A0ABR0TSB6_AURPU